jgi:hypothetical protein
VTPVFVYFVMGEIPDRDSLVVKIGMAADPPSRTKELQTAFPGVLWIQKEIRCSSRREAAALERQLHQEFRAARISGEWFRHVSGMDPYLNPGSLN